MKHLMIPVFALVALIAAAAAMVWHPSTKLSAGTTAMPSMQELHTAAGVNKLPTEDFEDMSLIYSTVTKRPPDRPAD
jgi:hypothetical protein